MKLFFRLFFIAFIAFACKKDKPEKACTSLSETLIGSWTSSDLGAGTVEFKADNTLVDDNDLLVGFDLGLPGSVQKTWMLDGTELLLKASADGGSTEFPVDVTNFDCNKITLEIFGEQVVLNKQ